MKANFKQYTNTAVVAMGALSLLCCFTILILFIAFISLSRPSFRDLNKFDFAVLALNFFLTLIYGILTFIKDTEITKYGTKTWLSALILFTIVVTHNVVALYKHYNRILPAIAFSIPIAVSAIILLVNSHFYFNEVVAPDILDTHMTCTYIEEFIDCEEGGAKDLIKKIVNPAFNPILNDHVSMDGKLNWRRTHFILAIENDLTIKMRWKQIMGGIKSWLHSLSSFEDVRVSAFSFDTLGHNPKLYKTPSDMLGEIDGVMPKDNSSSSLGAAINNYEEVIKNKEGKKLKADKWLHHGILIATGESSYKETSLEEFLKFKKQNKIKFFFTAVTQVDNKANINRLTTRLGGIHYAINTHTNFVKAFTEAMQKHPLKD